MGLKLTIGSKIPDWWIGDRQQTSWWDGREWKDVLITDHGDGIVKALHQPVSHEAINYLWYAGGKVTEGFYNEILNIWDLLPWS